MVFESDNKNIPLYKFKYEYLIEEPDFSKMSI